MEIYGAISGFGPAWRFIGKIRSKITPFFASYSYPIIWAELKDFDQANEVLNKLKTAAVS